MVAPLLGLLGLAGGAMGQDWYFKREAREGEEKVKGLLGRPADAVPDGGYSNPDPGSGLMADPASIQRQLEFASGLMGLNPRQRSAARAIIEPIMGRASQGALSREGWDRQAAENRLGRAQAEEQFTIGQKGINDRFEAGQAFLERQFTFTREKHGEEQAWREFTWGKEHNLRAAAEARQAQLVGYQSAIHKLDLQAKLDERMYGKPPSVPAGYRGVMLPTGVPTDAPLGQGVMGPVRTDPGEYRQVPIQGSPDYVKASEGVDKVRSAQEDVGLYLKHITQHGFQKTGELVGEQIQLYKRVQDAVRVLRNTGVLNTGEIPELKAELPDPTEIIGYPVTQAFVTSHLGSLQSKLGREADKQRERYRGYNLRFYEPPKEAQGRSAPPAGSVDLSDTGAYRGRGKAPFR